MSNPYQSLPQRAFWRTAIAEKDALAISDLWDPKREFLPSDKVSTFGSCFAQHIGRALAAQNFRWLDMEPPPRELAPEAARERNYGVFSARTGNIYTAAAFRQWLEWALGLRRPPDEVWEKNGRYFDPFRPAIEPEGFSSLDDLRASREVTLRAVRETIVQSNHIVFTLGLTEAWINRESGYAYATCPGTNAGEFDAGRHAFKNYAHGEILADMQAAIALLQSVNERINVLLTVSPVPLTATASGAHVLVATTFSKSVLRGVAGELSRTVPCVDYFPSYEIITGVPFKGQFFAANQRSVTTAGVDFVMRSFFACMNGKFGKLLPRDELSGPAQTETGRAGKGTAAAIRRQSTPEGEDVVCEEEMLAAFGPAPAEAPTVEPNASAVRMCVIGNSHIGALRWAIKKGLFSDPSMDIVFWGFPGPHFLKVALKRGHLVHPNKAFGLMVSGGRYAAIPLDRFDVLLFVGCGLNSTAIVNWMTAIDESDDLRFYRRVRARLSKSHVMALMKSISRRHNVRIMYVPTPYHSEDSPKSQHVRATTEEIDRLNRVLEQVFAEAHATFIRQPPETIKENIWTSNEYLIGASGINHIGVDYKGHKHMNPLYGSVILSAVRDRLREIA